MKERKGREGKGGEVKTVKGEEEMKMLVMSQVRHTLGSYSLSEIQISLGVLYFIWQSYICSSQRLSSFHLSSHLSCTKLQWSKDYCPLFLGNQDSEVNRLNQSLIAVEQWSQSRNSGRAHTLEPWGQQTRKQGKQVRTGVLWDNLTGATVHRKKGN